MSTYQGESINDIPGTDSGRLNDVPGQECDLVMKGGVTSGVVYPPAILELAKKYRFRSIGGASAGAIAAAAAAAAEYGRQTLAGGSDAPTHQGFVRLAQMNEELKRPGFVRNLFQSSEAAKPLLQAFMEWQAVAGARKEEGAGQESSLRSGRIRQVMRWVGRLGTVLDRSVRERYRKGRWIGALVAGGLASGIGAWGVRWLLSPGIGNWLSGAVLLALALGVCWVGSLLGGLAAGGWALGRTLLRLQDKKTHKYGICPGSAGPAARLDGENLALVDWLHVRLNELGGLKPGQSPLTLRQLGARGINFKLVTSNLTLGQPYILPMRRGSRSFFFKRSEMERLFPPPVVEALVTWGRDNRPVGSIRIRDEDAEEFLRFPMNEDMPLVVATRLSLSFPILLSAVRLYSVKPAKYQKAADGTPQVVNLEMDLEEHWFSDGGISSNFPIHIFDTWVPLRPTFGITLYDSPITQVLDQRESASHGPSVLLPLPKDFDKARPQRTAIDGLADFLRAVFGTAQSYRDNAQSGLPSYRERIAQVFLSKEEGGLNLDMPQPVVERIQDKGRQAARLLLERYPSTRSAHFSEHRWVRLHVLMSELERQLTEVRSLFKGGDWKKQLDERFQALFQEQLAAKEGWYRSKDPEWCLEAHKRLQALLTLAESWEKSQREWEALCDEENRKFFPNLFFAHNPPRPEGILKITPDV